MDNVHDRMEHLATASAEERERLDNKTPFPVKVARVGFNTLGRILPNPAARLAYKLFSTPRFRARHKKEDDLLRSAERERFEFGEENLQTYSWGPKEGQLILLVHGWESRATALRAFVPGLVEAGFRVKAFDLPAHGSSSGKQTNMRHSADFVEAFIQAQEQELHSIIAHSMGCGATVFALSRMPNLRLQRLVLIGFPAKIDQVFQRFYEFLKLPRPVVRSLKSHVQAQFEEDVFEIDTREYGKAVEVERILLIHDKQDPIIPFSESKYILKAWDNAELAVTDGFGHFKLVKNPKVLQRVWNFICN